MNLLLFVVFTANVLGIFNDPFEFEGDYGPESNSIRRHVFELVVSREAIAKNLTDSQIKELLGDADDQKVKEYRNLLIARAIEEEKNYGPILSELVTSELVSEIKKRWKEVGFADSDLERILHFLEQNKDKKVFRFLKNCPPELLSLDKALRDQAAREGKAFDFPILGSTQSLEGKNTFELKRNLVNAVFTEKTIALTNAAQASDLQAFSTPAGQVFFYWMYQALNLHLISSNPEMISQVNQVKEIFARTIANPAARASALKEKLLSSNAGVLFTQESDAFVAKALTADGLFLPVDLQNPKDGTFVLLRSDLWEPDYEVIAVEGYEGFEKGRMNLILAKQKGTGQRFLLASCHGHSTNSEDGRVQISLVMEKFHELSDGNLQLLIGTDANTKTEIDVTLFREHLDALGLIGTQVGPTTIKKRMATAQHAKAGRLAIDEEDYLITLKPENGGLFQWSDVSVGFRGEKADLNVTLPNLDHPFDHYPVRAEFVLTPPSESR